MLVQRVITAILLAAFFLGSLFWLSSMAFLGLMTAGLLVASWEWARLSGLTGLGRRLAYLALLLLGIAAAGWWVGLTPHGELHQERVRDVLLVGCGWWAVALLWVQGYPSSAILWGSRFVRGLMGLLILIPAWMGLALLLSQPLGTWLVVAVVAVVALADMGGYFAGRRFGRRKLAPEVSPGKTVEGLLGGLAVNMVFALVLFLLVEIPGVSLGALVAGVFCVSLVSVLGDLLESMVKRQAGVKDSGAILPGHGGMLDRIDGLVAALPVSALMYLIMVN